LLHCGDEVVGRKRLFGRCATGYLTTLPPDQARARRMVHATVDDEIFVAKLATASRREGRRERRGMPKVRRMHVSTR
jgi:hypothetical protein